MLVVDTSALAAILLGEEDAGVFSERASMASEVHLSTVTAVEAFVVLRARSGQAAVDRLEGLMDLLSVHLQPVDPAQMRIAIEAYRRFGRGSKHPAKLNFGDCFSYALARALEAPLLFKGDDFGRTDIRSALPA